MNYIVTIKRKDEVTGDTFTEERWEDYPDFDELLTELEEQRCLSFSVKLTPAAKREFAQRNQRDDSFDSNMLDYIV